MILKRHICKSTLYFGLFAAVFAVICGIGFCRTISEKTFTMKLGGLRNTAENSVVIESMGRFAVQQYNKNQNTLLEFARVVKAKQQVVAGMMYHLTLEAVDGGKIKLYEAKVWEKSWMNFKQLQEFKEVHGNPIAYLGLGVKHGD